MYQHPSVKEFREKKNMSWVIVNSHTALPFFLTSYCIAVTNNPEWRMYLMFMNLQFLTVLHLVFYCKTRLHSPLPLSISWNSLIFWSVCPSFNLIPVFYQLAKTFMHRSFITIPFRWLSLMNFFCYCVLLCFFLMILPLVPSNASFPCFEYLSSWALPLNTFFPSFFWQLVGFFLSVDHNHQLMFHLITLSSSILLWSM